MPDVTNLTALGALILLVLWGVTKGFPGIIDAFREETREAREAYAEEAKGARQEFREDLQKQRDDFRAALTLQNDHVKEVVRQSRTQQGE